MEKTAKIYILKSWKKKRTIIPYHRNGAKYFKSTFLKFQFLVVIFINQATQCHVKIIHLKHIGVQLGLCIYLPIIILSSCFWYYWSNLRFDFFKHYPSQWWITESQLLEFVMLSLTMWFYWPVLLLFLRCKSWTGKSRLLERSEFHFQH